MSIATVLPSALAASLAREPQLTVIDVRTPAEFAEVHALPARNVPLPDLGAAALRALGHAEQVAPVYVLCQSGQRAAVAAKRLASEGFSDVRVVQGGTEAWSAAGLPVVKGSGSAIGIERQVRIGAGALVVLGVLLARGVHPDFGWLAAFVGAGLMFAGITGFCGMGVLLARAPWNRK
jgi:rhodanese-related sulfurtransferase